MTTDDGTFTLSVTTTRKVRVQYSVEHGFHHFTAARFRGPPTTPGTRPKPTQASLRA